MKYKQETLRVNNRDDLLHPNFTLKISIFSEPVYNPVEHLWWSFYCGNSKPLCMFTKNSIIDAHLDSKYASAFTWRLLQMFLSLSRKCPYSELFWSIFSLIWTEQGEILRISPYSVRMRENTDQNNSEYGHFSHSVFL